jgi:hypothetical protein
MKTLYSRKAIADIKRKAMKVKPGVLGVSHIYPRAYCIAKPAPGYAVFVTPFVDAESKIRTPEYSSSESVRVGANDVRVGDWCSIAYVSAAISGEPCVIEVLK